jgi:septal ring factor EnvC (AmiA/AmiB activator)
MWWVIWALLLVLSGAYLTARLWGLWGQTKELGSELAIAQERLDNVQGQMELLGERIESAEELAVFASPGAARTQRQRAKAEGRRERQERRATSSPSRARHVD